MRREKVHGRAVARLTTHIRQRRGHPVNLGQINESRAPGQDRVEIVYQERVDGGALGRNVLSQVPCQVGKLVDFGQPFAIDLERAQ